jgi:thioesterase domain-containing protein
MTERHDFDRQAVYQIRVKGNLDSKWADWFDGLVITRQADHETMLSGPVADQCALHGLLAKIRDLGLPLLSLERMEIKE